MPIFLKAAGIGGSILAILALVIVILKNIVAFIALLTSLIGWLMAGIKIVVILAFVAIFLAIGLMIYRTWSSNQKAKS